MSRPVVVDVDEATILAALFNAPVSVAEPVAPPTVPRALKPAPYAAKPAPAPARAAVPAVRSPAPSVVILSYTPPEPVPAVPLRFSLFFQVSVLCLLVPLACAIPAFLLDSLVWKFTTALMGLVGLFVIVCTLACDAETQRRAKARVDPNYSPCSPSWAANLTGGRE